MLESEPKAAQVSVTALSVYRGKQTECVLGAVSIRRVNRSYNRKANLPKNNQPTRFGGYNTNLIDTEGNANCCTKDLACKTAKSHISKGQRLTTGNIYFLPNTKTRPSCLHVSPV